jgi:predicted nucleic acid-binding protein
VLKDAPIIAAAKKGRTDYLVTLDKKHLLEKPELVKFAGIPIVTPKEAFEILTNK